MLPFAETVLAWRLFRGLTQEGLAQAARIPRPNLSAIERGQREVTLKTLRALAAALDVRPGVLADGETPHATPVMARPTLERIARSAADGRPLADAGQDALARGLADSMSARLAKPARGRAGGGRKADRAYFFLRASADAPTLASLVERTANRGPRR